MALPIALIPILLHLVLSLNHPESSKKEPEKPKSQETVGAARINYKEKEIPELSRDKKEDIPVKTIHKEKKNEKEPEEASDNSGKIDNKTPKRESSSNSSPTPQKHAQQGQGKIVRVKRLETKKNKGG